MSENKQFTHTAERVYALVAVFIDYYEDTPNVAKTLPPTRFKV